MSEYPTIAKTPVIVVGSEGRFGSWIYRLLQRCGAEKLEGFDRGDGLDDAAGEAHVAIVSVSLPEAPAVVRRLSGLMRSNALIVDVSSLKADVVRELIDAPQDTLLIHPMCAPPAADSLGDAPVALLHDGRIHGVRWAETALWRDEFLAALGGRIVRRDVASHDLICGVLQAAAHAALLGIAEQIASSGLTFRDFRDLAPPVGAYLLDAVEAHLGRGSPDIFAWLQKVTGDLPAHENPTLRLAFSAIETAQGSQNTREAAARWAAVSAKLFPSRYS